MDALTPYTGDLIHRARAWADLAPDELRRRATVAARDRDAAALWSLTESYLIHHGRKGARVSDHTLSAYRTGVRILLDAWQGVNLLHPGREAGRGWIRTLE